MSPLPPSSARTERSGLLGLGLGLGLRGLGGGRLGRLLTLGGGRSGLLGLLLALEQVALPLGQRLTGGLLALALAGATGTGDEALGDGVGDHAGEQGDGADRVVVARDL